MASSHLCFAVYILLQICSTWQSWPFPHYKQCNDSWGNIEMGTTGNGQQSTICKEGCAMTCVSMSLYGLGFDIYPGNYSNPAVLNEWLQDDDGYCCIDGDCNNLVLYSIDNLTNNVYHVTNPTNYTSPTMYDIRRGLDAMDTIFLAHNPALHHFVLATTASWKDETFNVIDPYFNATQYSYNETDGQFIVYEIYNLSRPYQYYAQCNATWAQNKMGKNGDTICAVGCLMSSVAMAMESYNIPVTINIDGGDNTVTTTPGTLNSWLQQNNGYTDSSSDLNEAALNQIPQNRSIWPSDGMHTKNDISVERIREYLQDHVRRVVIANVMEGEHFVLCVDIKNDMDTIIVNDPGQFHDTYSYKNDVVGWRLFDFS